MAFVDSGATGVVLQVNIGVIDAMIGLALKSSGEKDSCPAKEG